MNKKIKSLRGMHDYLPKETIIWQFIEKEIKKICNNYGYLEIKLPILEKTSLFKKSIGDYTDIIEKEMYSFKDKKGNLISLRPEATVSCCRAILQHDLLRTIVHKFWYFGPMFRYERPQKERFRQFYQFGVEVFNINSYLIELELILITNRIFKQLHIKKYLFLEINTIGSLKSRKKFQKKLIKFLLKNKNFLDSKDILKLNTNPLRILDSKSKRTQKILKHAPKLINFISEKEKKNFFKICFLLNKIKIKFNINFNLIRGLDYYNGLVFEWKSKFLGSQNALCGGGRYDSLIKKMSNLKVPALGFAIGIERLVALIKFKKIFILKKSFSDIYFIQKEKSNFLKNINFIEILRNKFPYLKIIFDQYSGNIKKKLIRAKKFSSYIVIIENNKNLKNTFIIKKYNEYKNFILKKEQIIEMLHKYFRKKKSITIFKKNNEKKN